MQQHSKVLLAHWGQSGGGPRFLYELSRAWSRQAPGQVTWSYDRGVEQRALFRELGIPSLEVATYRRTKGSIALALPRLPVLGASLRRFIDQHQVDTFVCVMQNHFQSLVSPVAVPRRVRYIACIHDAVRHPGEADFFRTIAPRMELRRADQVVVFSHAVAEQIRQIRPDMADDLIETLHPAWDTDDVQEANVRMLPTNRPIVLGFFGRLFAYKGLDLFLDATRILLSRGLDIRIAVHGQGPDAVLETSAQDVPGTWQTGWIPEEDVRGVFERMDVLVLPYREASQSGVFAQSLTYGVPSVGTPVGGLREQLEGTGAGDVAEAVSALAIADAIERLLRDPSRYCELSKAALAAARETHTWNRVVRDLDNGINWDRR